MRQTLIAFAKRSANTMRSVVSVALAIALTIILVPLLLMLAVSVAALDNGDVQETRHRH